MDTKEKFKDFVKANPKLLTYVNENKMTWQKFYEMYDMYGEDSTIWNNYLNQKTETLNNLDILGFLKTLDLDSLEEGINSIQRVLGLLQDMSPSKKSPNQNRRQRPLYRHFED